MKKKRNLLVALIFVYGLSFAQPETDWCFEPHWDFENPSTWKIYTKDTREVDQAGNVYYSGHPNYPFNAPEINTYFAAIKDGADLQKQDGWVLLQKNFGCSVYPVEQPYAVFYNSRSGILRFMALNMDSEISTSGVFTAKWGKDVNGSSLLTFTRNFSLANSSYPDQENDMVLAVIDNYAPGQWWVVDFPTAFDEKTNELEVGKYLDFSMESVLSSTLNTSSTFEFSTTSEMVKGDKSEKEPTETEKGREWLVDKKKRIEDISWGTFESYAKSLHEINEEARKYLLDKYVDQKWNGNGNISKTLNYSMDATQYLHDQLFKDNTLIKFLKSGKEIGGAIGGTLGVVLEIMDFFSGSVTEDPNVPDQLIMAPTFSKGTMTTTGNIETKGKVFNYSFPLPGTSTSKYSYYTCPLGIINLQEYPQQERRDWDERLLTEFHSAFTQGQVDSNVVLQYDSELPGLTLLRGRWRQESWKSVRIRKGLKLAVNRTSNLRLVDAQVALVSKVRANENGDPQFDFFENAFYDGPSNNNYLEMFFSRRWENYTYKGLANEAYFLLEGGEDLGDGKRNGLYKFRTEFVDIEDYDKLSITTRKESDVYIKIIASFQSVEDPSKPITLFANEYLLDDIKRTESGDEPFPFSKSQSVKFEEFLANKDLKTLSSPVKDSIHVFKYIIGDEINYAGDHSLVLEAEKIKLLPDCTFRAKESKKLTWLANEFTFQGIEENEPINKTTTIQYYKNGVGYDTPEMCDCMVDTTVVKKPKYKVLTNTVGTVEKQFKIVSNPVKNDLRIINSAVGKSKMYLFDMQGREISNWTLEKGTTNKDFLIFQAEYIMLF